MPKAPKTPSGRNTRLDDPLLASWVEQLTRHADDMVIEASDLSNPQRPALLGASEILDEVITELTKCLAPSRLSRKRVRLSLQASSLDGDDICALRERIAILNYPSKITEISVGLTHFIACSDNPGDTRILVGWKPHNRPMEIVTIQDKKVIRVDRIERDSFPSCRGVSYRYGHTTHDAVIPTDESYILPNKIEGMETKALQLIHESTRENVPLSEINEKYAIPMEFTAQYLKTAPQEIRRRFEGAKSQGM
ncbi:MAG: hypothetical protein K2Q12_02080 [Rickettsiales bacterium]|nr:hypothetical protein [Rickettsiales bacterium]